MSQRDARGLAAPIRVLEIWSADPFFQTTYPQLFPYNIDFNIIQSGDSIERTVQVLAKFRSFRILFRFPVLIAQVMMILFFKMSR